MYGSGYSFPDSTTITVVKTINFNGAVGGADSGNETSATTFIAEVTLDGNIISNEPYVPQSRVCW